jgi:lipopolysaccharide export system permease protein
MQGISRYIFDQVATPVFFFVFVFAGVAWLTNSLRMLDLIINQSQTILIYLYLTILMLPGLISLILPFALFGAVLFALNRLYIESELIVISAAGFSRWAIAYPVVLVCLIAILVSYVFNLVLQPMGQREVKDRIFQIRADLLNTFIKEGAFTTPMKGLTVYVGERGGGEIRGLLVHDARKPKSVATYMAQRGMLANTPAGPRLIMYNGNIQWVDDGPSGLKVLNFEKYTLDLGQLDARRSAVSRESSERYLHELLYPEGNVSDKERRRFFADAHDRLTSPLYCLIFGLIGVLAVIGGTYDRRGYSGRLAIAVAAVLAARLPAYGIQSSVRSDPDLWPLLYIWPMLWLAALFYYTTSSRFQRWATPNAKAPAPEVANA